MSVGQEKVKRTFCSICSAGCAVDAYVREDKIISVEGSKWQQGQKGTLCAKGAALRQYVYNEERILYPMKCVGEKGGGEFQRIEWEEAFQIIKKQLGHVKDKYGGKSTAFYSGYPKWFRSALTRLSNAFGSPNFITESSTCFQAADIAWRLNYGNHICPPDLAHSNTLLLWSSNLYHSSPGMSHMFRQLKEKGVSVISVDSRNSVTAKDADIHLKPLPGTDGALALAMAHVMINEKLCDDAFIEKYVEGYEVFKSYVQKFTPEYVEKITRVCADKIRKAARLYATNGPASIKFSACTLVHHVNGVQNYRAIFALPALTGNYNVRGGNCTPGKNNITLRENAHEVKRFHSEEAMGEKEYPIWFELSCEEAQCTKLAEYILKEKPYPIKSLVAFGFNHHMWPQPSYMLSALKKLDFYVNTDIFWSDASRVADLVLPACTSFEREEIRTTEGSIYITDQVIEPLGESKSDLDIILQMAQHLGVKDPVLQMDLEGYFNYRLESAGLTISNLRDNPKGVQIEKKQQAEKNEAYVFQTPSGKIELYSHVLEKYEQSHGYNPLPIYKEYRDNTNRNMSEYPMILNTGSRKPQMFHARLYRMPWLRNLENTMLIEIHTEDAVTYGIHEADTIRVSTPVGSVNGIAGISDNGQQGVVYMYHGNKEADANELIDLYYSDPISGFPGYKSYFCKIEKVED